MSITNEENKPEERYVFLFKDTIIVCKSNLKGDLSRNLLTNSTNDLQSVLNGELLVFDYSIQVTNKFKCLTTIVNIENNQYDIITIT
jgi:hypothetical protein